MYKKLVVLSAILMFCYVDANAQGIYLGPQVGYQKAKDASSARLMYGAALRLKLSSALGVEGSINYRQEKYGGGDLTVRSWPVMVTGLIYPLPLVYGAIGAGWYNTTFDYSAAINELGIKDETKQKFGWHFGAGVELPAGASTKLTADIRYVFLNYKFKEVPGSSGTDSNFYVIMVGFMFGL